MHDPTTTQHVTDAHWLKHSAELSDNSALVPFQALVSSCAMKFLWTLVTLTLAAGETVDTLGSTLEALEVDDSCAAGDCSLELNQLRGMKLP